MKKKCKKKKKFTFHLLIVQQSNQIDDHYLIFFFYRVNFFFFFFFTSMHVQQIEILRISYFHTYILPILFDSFLFHPLQYPTIAILQGNSSIKKKKIINYFHKK